MKNGELKKRLFEITGYSLIVCIMGSVLIAGCISITSKVDKGFTAGNIQRQEPRTNKLVVHTDRGRYTINKNIYGHF